MTIRTFSLLGRQRFKSIESAIEISAGRWAVKWTPSTSRQCTEVNVFALPEQNPLDSEYVRFELDGGYIWLRFEDGDMYSLLKCAYPDLHEETAGNNSAKKATCAQLAGQLAASFAEELTHSGSEPPLMGRVETENLPDYLFSKGAGACAVSVTIGGTLAMQWVLSPHAVSSLSDPNLDSAEVDARAALCLRKDALQGATIVVDAVFGESLFSISEINALRPGDVLELDQAVTDSLRVRVAGGIEIGRCFLGAFGPQRAIQLDVRSGNHSMQSFAQRRHE